MDQFTTYKDEESPVAEMSGDISDKSFLDWAEDRFAIDDCI
jgi:hypothetical protein